ncbi:hypothetical protein N7510_005135 [Penicillium lagena]|uniref:uncharacterized protein n=1 Tax=Penicillium lagena TaxID=94218 RepID=UPI0025404656|nr:uncharacterized protein N7510_005135 [Penicillium lagena]KAJ5621151.1 hypothetical protein N7510_005135 [Penicillium lagena]
MADQIRNSSYVNPELAKILETGPKPASLSVTSDIQALRKLLSQRKKELTQSYANSGGPVIIEEDHSIPTRDGSQITVRAYKREHQDEPGPVLVIFHGGGWVLGGLENEVLLCRTWCEHFSGLCVNVDYRLAPENPFPIPVYDTYDALTWTASRAKLLGGNPEKGFIIGGISAGGGMAAAISHLYRDQNIQPPLTGIYLSIPSVLAPQAVPEKYKSQYLSRKENANGLILDDGAIALFRRAYKDDPLSPLMSPFNWPNGHANLPPTYFQICGTDPLRDEALLYEQVLREDYGVKTRADLYPGLPHGFWSWWPKTEFGKQHMRDSVKGLAWLLGQSE